jgi:subtilisin family serine protease
VLDTGIGLGAVSLPGARVVTRSFADGAPVADAHGAAVMELLAGPGRLHDAQVFYAAVVGTVPDLDPAAGVDAIMRAIDWLHGSGVRLVNVSLAGPYNKILDRGLAAAADRGMVIVAAVGNDGPGAPPRYPAAFDFVIAVTAVDADLAAYARAPRGSYIDFAAPGVDVFVPLTGSGRYMTGTSIAAPFVTALIASSPEAASLGSVATVRANLARDAVDLGAAGNDDTFGAGLARASQSCRA